MTSETELAAAAEPPEPTDPLARVGSPAPPPMPAAPAASPALALPDQPTAPPALALPDQAAAPAEPSVLTLPNQPTAPAEPPAPRQPTPEDLAPSDPRRSTNRLATHLDRLLRRDLLGVNAAVLLFLLAPLAFGYYARLHWSAYSFPPDSRYYVTMTLRDLGWSDARALTKQWTNSGTIAESWYFAHSDPTWLMVQSRMLYPFFAAPFVLLFGVGEGMPIASMVAFAVMLWAVARLVQRLYGPTAALAAGAVLGACGFMMNLAEAVTDPVAIAVLALILLNLPLGRRARAHNLVLLALLSVLLELSRQVMPTAAVMAFFAWAWATLFPGRGRSRRWRNDWLWPSLIVAGTTVSVHLLEGKLSGRGAGSQMSLVASDPTHTAWTITHYDVLSTVQGDRALSVLLAGALLFAVIRFTDIVAGLLLGATAGTYVIMIAGVEPSHMRYESILFPVAGLAVGALFHHLAPPALRGGVVGDGTLRSDRLPAVDTWWQRGPRRVPALGASAVVGLAFLVGWSATHGSQSMAGAVPTAPAAAAALAGDPHAELPDHTIAAEAVLSAEFTEADKMAKGANSLFLLYADWRHPMRYRPLTPNQPGWAHRNPEGTVVLYPGDLDDSGWTALSRAFTYNGTIDPATVKVTSRATSAYGQDVTFTVSAGGTVHRGHATVVYPIRAVMPGIVTEMVFDS